MIMVVVVTVKTIFKNLIIDNFKNLQQLMYFIVKYP